jgi:hypothetical protein
VLIAYGYQAQDKDDPIIAIAESAMDEFKTFRNSGVYLVDSMPLCIPVFSNTGIIPDLTYINS